MRQKWSQIILVALAVGLLGGVALVAAAQEPAWIKTEIYLGQNLPGGHEVGRQEWNDFLDKVVTKQFPKGLTVFTAYGQMQHADGRIEEQSTLVLAIVHPKDAASDKAVQAIVEAFRKQFGKAQVIVLHSPVTAQFYGD